MKSYSLGVLHGSWWPHVPWWGRPTRAPSPILPLLLGSGGFILIDRLEKCLGTHTCCW